MSRRAPVAPRGHPRPPTTPAADSRCWYPSVLYRPWRLRLWSRAVEGRWRTSRSSPPGVCNRGKQAIRCDRELSELDRDPQAMERGLDRAQDCGRGGDRARLPHPPEALRVLRRARFEWDDGRLDGHLRRRRNRVVQEGRPLEAGLGVVGKLLEKRIADAVSKPAMHLPFDDHRV